MGRRESAVAAETRQSEALALWLRDQRQRAGLTYTAMALTTSYSASMLSRAASGRSVPSWRIVESFARACDADLTEAKQRWRKARWANQKQRRARGGDLAKGVRDLYSHQLVRPELIETFGQLSRAMWELRAKCGQPSEAELQRRAGLTPDGEFRLPRSSLGAILRGELVPRIRHVTAFTEALGLPPRMVAKWEEAWERAADRERSRASRPPAPGPAADAGQPAPVRIRINIPGTPPARPGGTVGRVPAPGRDLPGYPRSAGGRHARQLWMARPQKAVPASWYHRGGTADPRAPPVRLLPTPLASRTGTTQIQPPGAPLALRPLQLNTYARFPDRRLSTRPPAAPSYGGSFLHLRNVTYRASRTTRTLSTWRGPIDVISGWTLGEPDQD
ncbi:hypothetical protein GCM10009760_52830 [Kitasatospora kazusensis]|uniref:HTH cro/C1-type domain-containing protein n=1 Tax=Kitasatospora kazusensis TaxID=407974 RepID=A0ABN3A547_9ACTN